MPQPPHPQQHHNQHTHRDVEIPHHDPSQLSALILTTWTAPGALIADLDNDPHTEAHAAETGRRYYPPTTQELHHNPQGRPWADLILLGWPRTTNPHQLLTTCRRILQPAGHIIIKLTAPPDTRIGHLHALAGAAAHTRLRLHQHVTCTDPHTDSNGTPHTDLLALTHWQDEPWR